MESRCRSESSHELQNVDAGKAFLSNPEVTESYCQLCMERVEKYEMMDIPEGLFYVTNELNLKYQSRLTVYDIIDKYMELLSCWKIWTKLIKDEEKLAALDWVNGKITSADNSWWERKLKEFPEAAFICEGGLPNVSILEIVFESVTMVVPKDAARFSFPDSDSEGSTAGSDKVELMKKVKRRLAKIPELKSDEALAMFCKEFFVDLSKRAWFCAIQPNQRLLWLQSEFQQFNKRQQESGANESHSAIARESHSDAESVSESLKKSPNQSDERRMY
ncbi:hypothetical protein SO802_017433 [Lithocarpus litseifolius]|uniref:Uncharacterized protein n=1 Tax=Lithocarpus litseifolius TaxID=425828 RepID=A0AAW2CMT2_9ROSI